MAQKRMFSKDIVDSDTFYDLPFTSQLLYFHLGMHADVKGFVQPKKIIRAVGLKVEDLRPLMERKFIIPFETGVVVITHWKLNNQLREEKEAKTLYKLEYEQLSQSDGVYRLLPEYSRSTPVQRRGEERRVEEVSIEEGGVGEGMNASTTVDAPAPKKNKLIVYNYDELAKQLGTDVKTIQAYEEKIRDYMLSKGRRYRDMAATIRNWYRRDQEKKFQGKSFYEQGIVAKQNHKKAMLNYYEGKEQGDES